MNYYTVPAIKTTNADGTKTTLPDVPIGTHWVGNVGSDGEYLIATPSTLPAKTGTTQQLPQQALQNACNTKRLPFNDVYYTWYVKG